MILDILFAVIAVLAIIKGYQRGLIVGIFSFIAIIIGLAAAIKLSLVVSEYLGTWLNISEQWLPLISFLVVFFVVVLLVRLGANLIQKSAEVAMLGWLNRLGGIVLYLAIFIAVYSVLLFYAEQIHVIRPATIDRSATYSYVSPVGPKAIDTFGNFVPIFKNMFHELQEFFEGISHKMR